MFEEPRDAFEVLPRLGGVAQPFSVLVIKVVRLVSPPFLDGGDEGCCIGRASEGVWEGLFSQGVSYFVHRIVTRYF